MDGDSRAKYRNEITAALPQNWDWTTILIFISILAPQTAVSSPLLLGMGYSDYTRIILGIYSRYTQQYLIHTLYFPRNRRIKTGMSLTAAARLLSSSPSHLIPPHLHALSRPLIHIITTLPPLHHLSHPRATEKDSIIPLPPPSRFITHYPAPHRYQLVTAAPHEPAGSLWRRYGQVWHACRSRLTARTPRAPPDGQIGGESAVG